MIEAVARWVARAAYRVWASYQEPGRKPVGVPFHRDPQAPCHCYEPRSPKPGDWRDCLSDGHYLCVECCHLDPAREAKLEADREWIIVVEPIEPK
jgi:hypothetical protein